MSVANIPEPKGYALGNSARRKHDALPDMATMSATNAFIDNELICEHLFGWIPVKRTIYTSWVTKEGFCKRGHTPQFADWSDAGLILDAFAEAGVLVEYSHLKNMAHEVRMIADNARVLYGLGETGPLAIRHAALEYLKHRHGW
jgi:hypothetical protein